MLEQTKTVSEAATWFEAFILAHPVVTCILLAWVVSWVLTVAFRPVLRYLLPDGIERHVIRLFDVVIAFFVVLDMWPHDFAHWWAAGIGGASPFAYFVFSELICWKLPAARRALSLRELAEPSETPNEPPKDTTP
jgi:hypothetical protein